MAKTADEHIRRHAYAEKLLTHMPVIAFETETARIYAELYAYILNETKCGKVNVHEAPAGYGGNGSS